eukprot:GHVU01052379.1.p1 GENE.GHVU01052379.1~~GHVU01052379.1.p1  ORF type:complete len:209 (-),score=5.42 GHVU01052379.1:34-660(-)
MAPVRYSRPRRPKVRKKRTTWQEVTKFWFNRLQLTSSTLLERLERQHQQAQDDGPMPEGSEGQGAAAAHQVSGTQGKPYVPPSITKPEHVWSCSRCGYIVRGNSLVRLRQHLVGRFVLPQDRHAKVRICRGIGPDERADLKASLAPLLQVPVQGSGDGAACGGEPPVDLLSETPPAYIVALETRADVFNMVGLTRPPAHRVQGASTGH